MTTGYFLHLCTVSVVICLSRIVVSDRDMMCLNRTGAKAASVDSLPESFRVSIEFVDQDKNFSADITEFYDQKLNLSALKSDNNGLLYDIILNRSSNLLTFVNKTSETDPTCSVSAMTGNVLPGGVFFFPSDQAKVSRPIVGLVDLFDLFKKSPSLTIDESSTDHDHGVPVQHLIGCTKTSDGKSWLEIKVCMTDKNFTFSNVKKSQSVPTRMEVKIYEDKSGQNPKFDFNGIYEIFGYKTALEREEENYRLPPRGVYCKGTPNTIPVPELPIDFSVEIEYVDHNSKIIDADEVYYDSANKMIGLEFSQVTNDEPRTIGALDQSIPGHYRMIQDFNTGFQYVLDSFTSRCIQVVGIPGHAGSIKPAGKDKRLIGMKEPFELLFVLGATNYTYLGKRYGGDVPLDVWQAFEEKKSKDSQQKELIEKIIYEIWVSNETWTYSGFRSSTPSLPVYFKVYRSDNYGRKNFTVQKFHNYIIYNESRGTDWPKLDVFTCLNPVATDFFMIEINDTLANLKNVGLNMVTRRLREIIAQYANVSILRVGDFHMFTQDNDKQLANVSFGIADKLQKEGSKTEFYQPEIDAKTALLKLNGSLLSGDLKFDVISLNGSKTTFCIRKATLSRLAYFDGKSIVVNMKKGYTGGSMATMAFFMLLIGAVGGVLLAYVYIKRTRGGIAYQIYE